MSGIFDNKNPRQNSEKALSRKDGKSIFILNSDLPIVAQALTNYSEKLNSEKARVKDSIANWEIKYLPARKNISDEEWQKMLDAHATVEIRQKKELIKKLDDQLRINDFLLDRFVKLQYKTRCFS